MSHLHVPLQVTMQLKELRGDLRVQVPRLPQPGLLEFRDGFGWFVAFAIPHVQLLISSPYTSVGVLPHE